MNGVLHHQCHILRAYVEYYKRAVSVSFGGGGVPYKRLLGMCHWMGSHFHDWIDYNGILHIYI